jgi:hypothetical protein
MSLTLLRPLNVDSFQNGHNANRTFGGVSQEFLAFLSFPCARTLITLSVVLPLGEL